MTQPAADIGLIGLGVMGRNLALNWDDQGYTTVCSTARPLAGTSS